MICNKVHQVARNIDGKDQMGEECFLTPGNTLFFLVFLNLGLILVVFE